MKANIGYVISPYTTADIDADANADFDFSLIGWHVLYEPGGISFSNKVGQLLLFADRAVGDFMSEKLGQDFLPPYNAIGIVGGDGRLFGGMLFNQYVEGDVEVTCYAPGRLLRGPIRAGCAYAFETLGCSRMSARTRASSLAVQTVLRKIGFQQEGTLREYYLDGEDAVLFGSLKRNCKWLQPRSTP